MKDKILIVGRSKFLGRHISELFDSLGIDYMFNYKNTDLRNRDPLKLEFKFHPEITQILALQTFSGNVQFNQLRPAETFINSSLINLNVLQTAIDYKVKKITNVLSSCCLPDFGSTILREDDLHQAPPNPTVESHGYAKRVLEIGSRQIRYQYGINSVTCILQNLMGPYDSLDLDKSKVVMSLIKRFVTAKNNNSPKVELWGSGIAKRQFLFAPDAAQAILRVIQNYNEELPINITPPYEVSIKELAEKIKGIIRYEGRIEWLTDKGDGQLRRKLDTYRMNQYLSLDFTPFDEGLRKTIEWYQKLES